jgi:hypothetical protein
VAEKDRPAIGWQPMGGAGDDAACVGSPTHTVTTSQKQSPLPEEEYLAIKRLGERLREMEARAWDEDERWLEDAFERRLEWEEGIHWSMNNHEARKRRWLRHEIEALQAECGRAAA